MLSLKKNLSQLLRKIAFVRSQYITVTPPGRIFPGPTRQQMSERDISIWSAGLLNWLWHAWNYYWRTWWLVHLCGGKNASGNLIAPLRSTRIAESLYYMLFLAGKRRSPAGVISGTYQEATWGDSSILITMASNLPSVGTTILSGISAFGQPVKHLQVTRNTAVHPSSSSFDQLYTEVIPYYSVRKINYATDVLLSRELATGKRAILLWLEELEAFALEVV